MKMIKTSLFLTLILHCSLNANEFKEGNITVDKANKIAATNKGKYVTETELKNEKIKSLEASIISKQKELGNYTNQKNNSLQQINKEKESLLASLSEAKQKEIAAIEEKYQNKENELNNKLKEKEHQIILKYNQNTSNKLSEIDLNKKEIIGLKKIEKVVNEKINQPPVVLSNLTVIYKYIERNNHLDRVMIDVGLIDSIKLYMHTLKKGLPFAVKKRALDYSLSIAEKTNGIDLEYYKITLKNEKLDDIENMMVDINEYISKNNNILLEK